MDNRAKKIPPKKPKAVDKEEEDDHDESDSEMATEDSLHNSTHNSTTGEMVSLLKNLFSSSPMKWPNKPVFLFPTWAQCFKTFLSVIYHFS
jgi:hypothetical protein